MYWRDYFHIKISKASSSGLRPYFEAQLQVHGDFTFEELKLKNFSGYAFNEKEQKLLTPELRKILLRSTAFNSREFERIAMIFSDRLREDKDRVLSFHTEGGGIYLFLLLLRNFHRDLEQKSITCSTSEFPLNLFRLPDDIPPNLRLLFRPETKSYLNQFSTLWQDSPHLELFEIVEHNLKVS